MCSDTEGLSGSAPVSPIKPPVLAAGAPPSNGPAHRILLVEDHADTAAMMRRLLVRRGYAVTLAATRAQALDAAAAKSFDLLLSDLGLPDGSGLDLARELSLRSPKLPAIALTGYGMPEDARKSLEAGFIDHLTKPVAVERLWAVLDRVLASPVRATA